MEIFIQNQKEYDEAVKKNLHKENELVIQNCGDFISVSTDVTVAGNGRCKVKGDSPVSVRVKENGAVTAEGRAVITGSDNANIAAKGNCTVTLEGSATARVTDNCNVTIKGKSRITAHDSCTVHAYDESAVSAFGKSKVFTYQKAVASGTDVTSLAGRDASTLIGKNRCGIKARDNCLVFATDGCKVEAADNCLVIANKEAKIISQNNCVVMSNDNPDVTLFDQADHLNLDTVTELNIMGCLKRLSRTKAFVERPYVAVQLMMANLPPERKEGVNRRLAAMGCRDRVSTKNYLYSLIKVGGQNRKERAAPRAKESGYMER
jgi:hypothetical protein